MGGQARTAGAWVGCMGAGVWVVWSALLMMGVGGFSGSDVTSVCDSMRPLHLAPLQTTPPPYDIHITPTEEGFYVTVMGKGNTTFKGFLLEARDYDGQRVGRFTKVQRPAKIITCSFRGGAVQHRDSRIKHNVTVLWHPDNYKGPLKFKATVVQSYSYIWTGIKSKSLKMLKHLAAGAPEPLNATEVN